MAGSRIDVLYTHDDGTTQSCINVDESNIEMIMGAQQTPNSSKDRPPSNLEVRHVVVKDVTGTISRRIPVLTLTRYSALNGATALTLGAVDSDSAVDVRVSSKTGEKQRRIPRNYDSGRTDGD